MRAAGALFEAQSRNIRVPEQLSIIGMDSLELSEHVTPALSTAKLPTAELGRRAAELVLARLEGAGEPRAIELPIDFIVRKSTGRPPNPAN